MSPHGKPTTLAYMDHPLSDPDTVERQDNIAWAMSWYGFLVDHTEWSIEATWLTQANLAQLNTELRRPRILADQVTILNRCDVLVLVGGRISGHMMVHRAHCEAREQPVLDLTWLGARPSSQMSTYQKRKLRTQLEMIETLLGPHRGGET